MPADLSQIDIFQELPKDSLARLAMLSRERTFSRGSPLIRQGDLSDRLYVIIRGRVRIERSHPKLFEPVLLAELGPDEVVGELGLQEGEVCSSTVTAVEEVRTLELGYTALALTVLQYPEALAALQRTRSWRLVSAEFPLEVPGA